MSSANIARYLSAMAAQQPDIAALKIPHGRASDGTIRYLSLTFAELEREVDAWAVRLVQGQVAAGDRVLLMVRPGLPLIASAFALFKVGAVPVIIDPGMGRKSFLACVRRSKPQALLGIPLARILSHLFRASFRTVRTRISASGSAVHRLVPSGVGAAKMATRDCAAHDLAAILFTSGSTGEPKGVCYEHGMFEAQVRSIRTAYDIQPREIDLPMLPIFALFNPALGMTTVVPEINPSRPASVDPRKIVQAIHQEKVTNSFGSPTLWNKIADYCIENSITLPSVRRILCAGAPVPSELWEKSRRFLPNGQLHSPYGATEALPISTISAAEVFSLLSSGAARNPQLPFAADGENLISSTTGRGACVGYPVSESNVRVIVLQEGPIATLADAQPVFPGQIGEIIVQGPVVTREYDHLPAATAEAKIRDADGIIWHRMGDCGFIDEQNRLWFCGRKVERLETTMGTLFTEPIERLFRADPDVARCALIGLGGRPSQIPALVIQVKTSSFSSEHKKQLAARLRNIARADPQAKAISRFFFHPKFPVDVRHNAKIHRLTLAKWAATQIPLEIE